MSKKIIYKFTLDDLPEETFLGCGLPDNDCGFARLYPEEVMLLKEKGIWVTFRAILFEHWQKQTTFSETIYYRQRVKEENQQFQQATPIKKSGVVYKIYREVEEEKVKYIPKKIECVKQTQVVIPHKNQPKKEVPKQIKKISYEREKVIYLKRPNLRSDKFPMIKCIFFEAEVETVNHVINVKDSHTINNIDLKIKDDNGNQTLFFLFEDDTTDLSIQYKAHDFFREEEILYRAVFSGNKSIHFLIKASIENFTIIDNATYKNVWDEINYILTEKVRNSLGLGITFDDACATLNHLTRTPDGKRFLDGVEKEQTCLSHDNNIYTVELPFIFLVEEKNDFHKNIRRKKKNTKYEDNFDWVSYCNGLFIKGQRTKNLPKIVGKICNRISLNDFLDYIDNHCDANDPDRKNLQNYARKLWSDFNERGK